MCLFATGLKKARAEGKQCHAKTIKSKRSCCLYDKLFVYYKLVEVVYYESIKRQPKTRTAFIFFFPSIFFTMQFRSLFRVVVSLWGHWGLDLPEWYHSNSCCSSLISAADSIEYNGSPWWTRGCMCIFICILCFTVVQTRSHSRGCHHSSISPLWPCNGKGGCVSGRSGEVGSRKHAVWGTCCLR